MIYIFQWSKGENKKGEYGAWELQYYLIISYTRSAILFKFMKKIFLFLIISFSPPCFWWVSVCILWLLTSFTLLSFPGSHFWAYDNLSPCASSSPIIKSKKRWDKEGERRKWHINQFHNSLFGFIKKKGVKQGDCIEIFRLSTYYQEFAFLLLLKGKYRRFCL